MNNSTKTVAKFEITRQLKKPSFWISLLLMPVLLGGIFLISFFANSESEDNTPTLNENTRIAITDDANILPKDNPFSLYNSKEEGINALKSSELDYYFYIPSNFAESKSIEYYHISEGLNLFDTSGDLIRNILTQYSTAKVGELDTILLTGSYSIEENKLNPKGEDSNILGKAIIPLIVLVAFFVFVVIFGNRLLMTVVEEKENRISEIILTTVSSKHLIIGKLFAMLVLGLIQILTFILPIIVIIFLNRQNTLIVSILEVIEIDPITIIMNLILFVSSLVLFTGFCTFIGTISPTAREASQFIGPIIVGVVFPFYFMTLFLKGDITFFVEFLTFFPLSAPIAMMLRNAFGTLSPIEFYIGLIEITALSIIIINLTIKTFQKNAINFSAPKLNFKFSNHLKK